MNNVYTKTGKLVKRIYFGATLIWEALSTLFKIRVENDGGTFEESYTDISNEGQKLLLTPNGYKGGKLYAALPQDGTGDFTVERNSTATRVNKDGLIEVVPANTPRIDYSTGEPMLLVENTATNNFLYSNGFENAAWNKRTSTVTPNAGIAPDGTNTAYRWLSDVGSTGHYLGQTRQLTEGAWTISFYVKSNTSTSQEFIFFLNNGGSSGGTSLVKLATDEWQRFSYTLTVQESISAYQAISRHNGQPVDLLIWGAMISKGKSSYIPTNGSTVTRLADNIHNILPASGNVVITFADGTTQTISGNAGAPFTLPNGLIEKVEML